MFDWSKLGDPVSWSHLIKFNLKKIHKQVVCGESNEPTYVKFGQKMPPGNGNEPFSFNNQCYR